MGFTRYWTIGDSDMVESILNPNKDFGSLDDDKFSEFSKVCQVLVDELKVPLDDVIINDRLVRFNGVDEDAHETFHFSLDKSGFNFCKTNLKPYDVVVCGCLYVAKQIFGSNIRVNQDCDESEDLENINLVKSIIRNNKLEKIIK